MDGLNKLDLDYLVRTIMPELYERKRKQDEYLELLMKTLPEKPTDIAEDSIADTTAIPNQLEEMRLSA